MKRILLSLLILATVASHSKVNAQCTVTQPIISNVSTASNGSGGCNITFDLSFNLTANAGNKITVVYLYTEAGYAALPVNFYANNGTTPPDAADLNTAGTLATIKINPDSALTTYLYKKEGNNFTRPTSIKSNLNYTVSSTGPSSNQFTIKGITLTTATACNAPITIKGDVLSSQSPDLTSGQCIARGLTFSANEPRILTGTVGCDATRTVNTTFITATARTITYSLYKDVAPVNQFTGADTANANRLAGPIEVTTVFNASTGDYRAFVSNTYTVNNGEKFNVYVVARATGIANISTALAESACAPLPVSFKTISATRNRGNVAIKWETATESNNKGFNVQRNISGTWETIAFVNSQALGGNSSSTLVYNFTDANGYKGVSQYRLEQVDINGATKYSEIRSVRGETMASKLLVYPNPSTTGKVSVVFEDGAPKSVQVSDMSGRVVKSLRNVSNNVAIEGLESGVYSIQVTDLSSAVITVEKVIIKKR